MAAFVPSSHHHTPLSSRQLMVLVQAALPAYLCGGDDFGTDRYLTAPGERRLLLSP